MITQDGSYRRGAEVKLKPAVDEAVLSCPSVKNVVVYKRTGTPQTMFGGRDHWWHELMANASDECPAEPLDAEHPLYLLYTSGTTGKPKGILHTTGGYSVGTYITTKWVFDLKDEDVYWCTADIGWVTGHSYIVYGPLQNGATTLMYEGAPNFPEPDRFWRIIDRHKVNIFYTAPTAIRAFMRFGDAMAGEALHEEPAAAGHGGRADQSRSLDVVSRAHRPQPLPHCGHLVADRNRHDHDRAAAGRDAHHARLGHAPVAGRDRRRGDARGRTRCRRAAEVPGVEAARGRPCCAPSTAIPSAIEDQYWSQIPGMYFTGDGARKDEDGYFWIMGRIDDVINVSGHRLSTMEVESALVAHPQGGGSGGGGPAGRSQGPGDRGVRHAEGRPRAELRS